MSAQENSAHTHSSTPHYQHWPQQHGDRGHQDQDTDQHHCSGGVTRGEAELIHHVDRGVLIINIVRGSTTTSEGLDDGDHSDVEEEGEQEVEEEGGGECVEPRDCDE